MSDSVGKSSIASCPYQVEQRIPRTGSARPPSADRLKLYGLYKQSMEGDVQGVMDRPIGSSEQVKADQEKWDAWSSQRLLSRTAAKRAYISTLIETMHQFASSTPEGRELVTELEFVWDQIKANSASSSNSSPGRGPGAPTDQQQQHQPGGDDVRMSYASLGGLSIGKDDLGDGNLRVLRPVSEGEDDEEEEFEGEEGDRPVDPNAPLGGIDRVMARQKRDLDVRNRKWRKRIEIAMLKMTTEVAALREQIEDQQIFGNKNIQRSSWAWIRWLIWITIRQLIVDTAILGLVFVWARRKNDQRIEQGLWLVLQAVKEQVKRSKLLTIIRLGSIR
ncbi:MAG: hypothetical protein Q9167_007914 [Letrouitia subvulpina]